MQTRKLAPLQVPPIRMGTWKTFDVRLTQEQIDFYQTNGYIVVENVISAKDIAELRKIT